jgi:hypothetical protein
MADTKALETLLRTVLAERDAAQNASLKKLITEAISESNEIFNHSMEINKMTAALHDLSVSVNSIQKAPKAPSSKQGVTATKVAGGAAAPTTTSAPVAKLNIMQFGKQELATNNDLLHEYETKITEKDPKEIDRLKGLETVTSRKNDVEKRKAYVGELYKTIKDHYADTLMKDLKARHEKWKGEQQKDEHPEKLEETPAAT